MDEEECSICLDYMSNSIKGECKLLCSHKIHCLCLQDLLDSELKQLCPICRKPIEIDTFTPPEFEIKSEFHLVKIVQQVKQIRPIPLQINNTIRSNIVVPINMTTQSGRENIRNETHFNKFKILIKKLLNFF
jgi:hypothetical protein